MNNKPWRNFKLRLYQHLVGIITKTYKRLGINREWLQFKISCSNTTTKMLIQPLEQCKINQFYHQKKFVILSLGCTLPNLANICPHNWTNEKFYPFCENDRDFCEKTRETMTGGTSFVFKRNLMRTKHLSGIRQIPANSLWNWCEPASPLFNVSRYVTGLGGATF